MAASAAIAPETACLECGAAIERNAKPGPLPERCPPCRIARRLERQRHRRKRKVKPRVRDEDVVPIPREAVCIECGEDIRRSTRAGSLPERCAPCRRRHHLEWKATYDRSWRRGERRTDDDLRCVDCGEPLERKTTTGPPRRRCRPCKRAYRRARHREYSRASYERRAAERASAEALGDELEDVDVDEPVLHVYECTRCGDRAERWIQPDADRRAFRFCDLCRVLVDDGDAIFVEAIGDPRPPSQWPFLPYGGRGHRKTTAAPRS